MKGGGSWKKKKHNKNSSVNQEQSSFQPRNRRESSRFNEGKRHRRAGLASESFVARPRCGQNPRRSSPGELPQPSLWEQKLAAALHSAALYLGPSLSYKPSGLQARGGTAEAGRGGGTRGEASRRRRCLTHAPASPRRAWHRRKELAHILLSCAIIWFLQRKSA